MSRNRASAEGMVSRVIETPEREEDDPSHPTATLRLRGIPTPLPEEESASGSSHRDTSSGPSVRWAPDVVDNEGMGKKQSKVCCIYVKPRAVDESSSSESDSSSSSDDDSDSDSGDERGRGKTPHNHDHDHHDYHDHDHDHGDENNHCHHHHTKHGKSRRKPRPNAYERQPKYNTQKK